MAAFFRAASALACCLMLGACLVTPGKFESTLDIRADRQFSFTYKGEIISSDMKGMGGSSATPGGDPIGDGAPEKKDSAWRKTALQKGVEERFDSGSDRNDEAQMQAITASRSTMRSADCLPTASSSRSIAMRRSSCPSSRSNCAARIVCG
jgi:hypothetical protein